MRSFGLAHAPSGTDQIRRNMTSHLIRSLEARDTLSAHEKEILQRISLEPVSIAAKTELVRQGDRPNRCILLLSGLMARAKISKDGRRQITALQVSGDFVDLHCFLLHQMDHAVLALTDCQVAFVSHNAIREISETQPHLTRLLWLSTVIDGALHREWLVAANMSSRRQFSHLICELYVRLEVVGLAADYRFDFNITQEVLADVLGISSVHVNRTLQDMRGALIEWQGAELKILNWTKLKDEADFDPIYLNLTCEPR